MQVRIEVSESVGLKAMTVRDLLGAKQFNEVFEELLSVAFDEIFKTAVKAKVGKVKKGS